MYKFVIPQENVNDDNVTITSVNEKSSRSKKRGYFVRVRNE